MTYLASLPVGEREKAISLLEDVVSSTPLRWNDKGELVVDRRVVKGSSLDKIVGHELKQKTGVKAKKASASSPPIGWETFAKYRQAPAPPNRRSRRARKSQPTPLDWVTY